MHKIGNACRIIQKKSRHDLELSSPTLAQNKMIAYTNKIRLDTNRKSCAKHVHEKILETNGIMCDFDHELMFPSNLEELGEDFSIKKLNRMIWLDIPFENLVLIQE